MPGGSSGSTAVSQMPANPSASWYRNAANELRAYARQLRGLIPGYQAILEPCVKLNNKETWYGQYPDQVTSQINSWHANLRGSGTRALEQTASEWEQLATQYDQQAGAQQAASHAVRRRQG